MIELKNLYKTFFSELGTEKQVFKGLNFTINDGDFITIIGSNGAGKSTLLNVLNGQIIPDGGNVILNGNDITNVVQHKSKMDFTSLSKSHNGNSSLDDSAGKFVNG